MSAFSIDWLDLRERADQRARNPELRQVALAWLDKHCGTGEEPTVVDLGAGTGATLRALAPTTSTTGPSPIWRLVDQDRTLLDEARRRHAGSHRLDCWQTDLTGIQSLPLEGAQLITASALFDLVSEAFIQALIKAMRSQKKSERTALYAALNYDGSTRWSPAHPLDQAILMAFNRDQRRDKGFGPALGPEAGSHLLKSLADAGYEVRSAHSPWKLGGDEAELVTALVGGMAGAVAGDPKLDPEDIENWSTFRLNNVQTGTCEVGHSDILALPAFS